jgi:hypothetical protein
MHALAGQAVRRTRLSAGPRLAQTAGRLPARAAESALCQAVLGVQAVLLRHPVLGREAILLRQAVLGRQPVVRQAALAGPVRRRETVLAGRAVLATWLA